MADAPRTTPLHDIHVAMGARMVEFAGFSMPVMFAGVMAEHVHTRTACSLFDISHMGRITLTGANVEAFLSRLCTRNLTGAECGRSYYTHICNEDGGVLDDVIVSKFESHWGVVCNGDNHEKIVSWFDRHRSDFDVALEDVTRSTAMLALQGPKTMELVRELAGIDLSTLKRYHFIIRAFMGMSFTIYRSGYTGEDGLEVVAPAGTVKMLTPLLVGQAFQPVARPTGKSVPQSPHPVIKPAGLGARDTLRIEAAMPLYGHELSEEVDSLTAGQGWCVDLSKDFIGAASLRKRKEQGLARRLVGLQLDGRRIARQHHKVFSGGRRVGEVTSGTLSPTLGKSIAMGFVALDAAVEGTTLEVDLGGHRVAARVVKLPFYKRPIA